VYRSARDFAKVEGWVRFPARTLFQQKTLEPDGQATGCNPVEVGSTPTSVSPEEAIPELVSGHMIARPTGVIHNGRAM
jgi:hypothetical protein